MVGALTALGPSSTGETWFPVLAEGPTALDRVINHRPGYAAAFREVETAIWDQNAIDPEILQLCRARITQLLGADDEVDPSLLDLLAHWPTSTRLHVQQRVCLGYAEQLLLDAQGVTDEQAAEVIAAVGQGGFLVLTYACGFFETTQRARLLLAKSER